MPTHGKILVRMCNAQTCITFHVARHKAFVLCICHGVAMQMSANLNNIVNTNALQYFTLISHGAWVQGAESE